MLTLEELKKKWFINTDRMKINVPPTTRYTGSTISVSTDGNKVEFIRDGQEYMKKWHDSIMDMVKSAKPKSCEVWHCGWRFEDVHTLGNSDPSSGALELLKIAHNAGVNLYGMLSGHAAGAQFNTPTILWLIMNDIKTFVEDIRFPVLGSAHHKFTCFRDPNNPKSMLGSIDISKTRWDTVEHLPTNPESNRDPKYGKPTHDTGVIIQGPAVRDIENAFKDRWNDSSRTWKSFPLIKSVSSPDPVPGGTHSIQVLTTFGIPNVPLDGHSWASEGDFTIWASYLNAIGKAKKYIYIEDQYFLPFDWPPCFNGGVGQEYDLFWKLGEAILHGGVKVLAVVPANAEDKLHNVIKYQRDQGIVYLNKMAKESKTGGDFVVLSLSKGNSDIYVHSKLMIIDDEFMLIGSANFGQRSMTHDSELDIGIVDSANTFVKEVRKSLWSEHLGINDESIIDDPLVAYEAMKKGIYKPTSKNHLRSYPFDRVAKQLYHKYAIKNLVDPYAGPKGCR